MTYNPSIPKAADLISNSQAAILANFSQLNTQFGIDHVAFNTGSGNGDGTHKQITFDNAPVAPSPGGTVSNIYPSLISGAQEMVWANAAGSVQITSGNKAIWKGGTTTPSGLVSLSVSGGTPGSGSMTLPNGIKFIWGNQSRSGSSTAVTFGSGGFSTNCLSCMITGVVSTNVTAATAYTVYNLSKTGFSFQYGGSTISSFMYFAIGN